MTLLLGVLGALALLALFTFVSQALARTRYSEHGPDKLGDTRSIGDLIDLQEGPVHIVFVHGMRAENVGGSEGFRAALMQRFKGASQRVVSSKALDIGDWPAGAKIGEQQIWRSAAEWRASQPFVDRHEITLAQGETVIVDEVNWWPLLFPIKCRFLLEPESKLSGPDERHLRLCARKDGHYHRWIEPETLEKLLKRRKSGAWANRWLKHEIMNWGLADAVIALGPMETYLIAAMEEAFAHALAAEAGGQPQQRVVISESLGSFVVMDAFRNRDGAVRSFLKNTNDLYFFANQFALLEIGRIIGLDTQADTAKAAADEMAAPALQPLSALDAWATTVPSQPKSLEALVESGRVRPEPGTIKQIVAISDPSDVLTYRVRKVPPARVVNVHVRTTANLLGLFAHPVKAHTGHVGTPAVWDLLLRKRMRR